jgi:hypothetical protein
MSFLEGFPLVDWTATFESDCIAAIQNYIGACRSNDPHGLVYRGVALDSLIARHLYVLSISSQTVQMHYAAAMAGQPCDLPLPDPHMRTIVAAMTGRTLPTGEIPLPPLASFAPAWRAVRRLKHLRRRAASNGGAGRPLLLMVHHPKFLHYFRPILDAMPGTGAFLLQDRQTQDQLAIADDEALAMPFAAPRTITAAVRQWRPLCVLLEEIETALRRHAPRCVLVAEGDAPYHEALALAGRKLGIPVLCLQWGAFPYRVPHLGFQNMSHAAFLSWGDGFSAQLRPFNPALRFVSVGNHMLLSRRAAPRRRILFLMQGADNYTILPDHWRQFMDFTAWTAETFPDWEVVVRPHPNLPLSASETARLAAIANVTLQDTRVAMGEALEGAQVAVTIVSSAILEALAQGVFPFLFNPTTMVPRFQPDLEAMGAGIEAKTLERAKSEMRRLLDKPSVLEAYQPALAAVRHSFFAAIGRDALDNIVSVVRQALVGRIRG